MLEAVERVDVKKLIPHREPFILIDRLVSYEKGKGLIASKGVTRNEPWAQGHFPDFPVMPGVLVTEALAQTCAAYMSLEEAYSEENTEQGGDQQETLYLLLRTDVKFPKATLPGATLELSVSIAERTSHFIVFKVKAVQNGKCCARGQITVASSSKERLVG